VSQLRENRKPTLRGLARFENLWFSNLLRNGTFLALGIAIIFTVFIAYGLYAIYEPPKYETNTSTCDEEYRCHDYIDKCQTTRKAAGKDMNEPLIIEENCYEEVEKNAEYQQCREQYDECESEYKKTTDRYKHARNSFYILLVIGMAAIIAGVFLSGLEGIGSGFIGGGVLVVLWTLPYTWEYWFELHKYTKVAALGLVLALLVYLGYKKLDKKK